MNEEKIIYDICKNINNDIYNLAFDIENIDFKKLEAIAIEQKIFAFICDFFERKYKLNVFNDAKRKIKLKNIIILSQINRVILEFKKRNIRFAISKGICIGKYIYIDPLLRLMNDVDIIVYHSDFELACQALEDLGYFEYHCDILKITNKNSRKNFYKNSKNECMFVQKGLMSIELKSTIQYITNEELNKWFEEKRIVNIDINKIRIPTFDKKATFINLLVNSYKNLHCPYGIENDYKIKDILELYLFICEYSEIFDEDFLEYIKEKNYIDSLSAMNDVFCEFFGCSMSIKFPSKLKFEHKKERNFDFMRWNLDIFSRIFCEDRRKLEHSNYRYNNYTTISTHAPVKIVKCEKICISVEDKFTEFFNTDFTVEFINNIDKLIIRFFIPKYYDNIKISMKIATQSKEVYNTFSIYKKLNNINLCGNGYSSYTVVDECDFEVLVLEMIKNDVLINKNEFYFAIDYYYQVDDDRSFLIASYADSNCLEKFVVE